MFSLKFNERIEKKLNKLFRKNPKRYNILFDKLNEIVKNPIKYKRLRNKMKGFFRVHIDKSFVLTFRVDEKEKIIYVEDFDHHDNIYKN